MNRAAIVVLIAACLAVLLACEKAAPPPAPPTEVIAARAASLPVDPGDAAWEAAPAFPAGLILQDLVEPRLLVPSTPTLEVRALTDGARVAFRLAWPDAAADDVSMPARFSDACAVQFPAAAGAGVPDPQMGDPGHPVAITYWSARWQAEIDGRPRTIQAIHPNASVDHYPYLAAPLEPGSPTQREMEARYAPARRLGNEMAGPHPRAVQDLTAEGPGTLAPAAAAVSDGAGRHDGKGWAVVLRRPLPEGAAAQGKVQVAFAVWQGGRGEVGSRKMRTAWVPLRLGGTP